jgi:chromosome segregation ATPase
MTTPEQELAEFSGTDKEGMAPRRRAARISQADVFAAADALLVMGARPTIDRVRMKLGRGSPNTINDHLDAWWAKLGARLRDLPGQEFPQLPERVAHTLQQLWNEALAGAHETLQTALLEREQSLHQREIALQHATQQLTEREHAITARAAALEESVVLARDQLTAANQRAQTLEKRLQERDVECARLRVRSEVLEVKANEVRGKLDAAVAAHRTERTQVEERHATAESHWLREVDRARQQTKDAAKEYQAQVKELRRRVDALQAERDELRENLLEARADLKTATAVREQLEARLHANPTASTPKASSPSNQDRRASAKKRRRSRGASDTGRSK